MKRDFTNPTTVISLEDHRVQHQDGGAGEISVTGLSGLLADDQHVLDAEVIAVAIAKTTVDAQSVLGGVTDNTPVAIAVAEQTVVGRITSGNVVALTVAQLWGLLSNYAEMYKHENATATNIQAANDWHFLNGFTTGEVGGGWSFHAGKQLAITAYATSDAGAKTQVTSATHAMVNGDIVSISNTAHYDGVHIVEQVATNTFVITVAFGGDDGASVGEHGGHFMSSTATASGKYLISYTLSLIPANPNDICEVTTFTNATQNIKGESQTKLGAVTDYQNVAGHSIKDITVNDIISIAVRNISGAGDFTIRDCNLTLVRIG